MAHASCLNLQSDLLDSPNYSSWSSSDHLALPPLIPKKYHWASRWLHCPSKRPLCASRWLHWRILLGLHATSLGHLMGFPGDHFRFPDIHIGALNFHIWPSTDFIGTLLGLIGLTLSPNGPLMAYKIPFWDLEYNILGLSGPLLSSSNLPFCLMIL